MDVARRDFIDRHGQVTLCTVPVRTLMPQNGGRSYGRVRISANFITSNTTHLSHAYVGSTRVSTPSSPHKMWRLQQLAGMRHDWGATALPVGHLRNSEEERPTGAQAAETLVWYNTGVPARPQALKSEIK